MLLYLELYLTGLRSRLRFSFKGHLSPLLWVARPRPSRSIGLHVIAYQPTFFSYFGFSIREASRAAGLCGAASIRLDQRFHHSGPDER